jgi:hypothetical protein
VQGGRVIGFRLKRLLTAKLSIEILAGAEMTKARFTKRVRRALC